MKFLLIINFIVHITGVSAQPKQDSIDAFVVRQMKEQKIVGLSIGIIVYGKVTKVKGYGWANLEAKASATEQSIYMLASVSKHMVAVGIMQLMQQGRLSLSDPCTKYFPDAPAHWEKITLRHLMNHTSGLPRESLAFNPLQAQPDSVLIKAAYNQRMVFETGTKWEYCNLGYFMLADIIRKVSGMPFQQYMTSNVFYNNGLIATEPTNSKKIIPFRADSYTHKGGDTILNAETTLAFRPSGAFISCVNDMLKWEMLIQQDKILSKANWQQMWSDTVTSTLNHPGSNSVAYGYGWMRTTSQNRNVVFHTGSLAGFRTLFYRFPDEKTAIVLLANSEPVDLMKVATGIADRLTPRLPSKK